MCAGSSLLLVFQPARLHRQELRLGDFGDHPGQLFLHQLVGGNGPVVELLADDRILPRRFVAIHGRADHAPPDAVARLRQARERGLQPFGAGQAVGVAHAAVGKRQAGGDRGAHRPFAVDVGSGVARRAALHQKSHDAFRGARPDHRHVGHAAVGDPGLLAVEDPGVALAPGGGAHARGVRAEIRLGQPEAADRLAALQARQPLLLLLLGAVGVNGVHDQRALHGNEAADAGIGALQLLHDEPVLHIAHAGAAVAFQVGAQEAELRHLRDEFGREARVAVAVADQRQNPLFGKTPRGLPHHQLLFAEQGVDAEVVYASESHCVTQLFEHSPGKRGQTHFPRSAFPENASVPFFPTSW